jgi:hypothetical protein
MRSDALISRRTILAGLAVPIVLSSVSKGWAQSLPRMTVTKDPSCGCCSGWIEYIKAAGFPVEMIESTDLRRLKERLGVPRHLASCHTAEVDGYVVEGHVPAVAIKRLLAERPPGTAWRFRVCLSGRLAWRSKERPRRRMRSFSSTQLARGCSLASRAPGSSKLS